MHYDLDILRLTDFSFAYKLKLLQYCKTKKYFLRTLCCITKRSHYFLELYDLWSYEKDEMTKNSTNNRWKRNEI